MTKTLKVALAGAGAFGLRHLDAIKLIGGVEVISVVGRELDKTTEEAAKYLGPATTDLAEASGSRGSMQSSWRRQRRYTPRRRLSVSRPAAIREGREPNACVVQVLPCYQVLDELERRMG
jgi:hypothetical protein